MDNAAKIVSSAILGMDGKTIIVNGKAYVINPPTIKKLVGAGVYLSDISEKANSMSDILKSLSMDNVSHALSWFIIGDDSLFDELSEGTFDEVVSGLEAAYSLISTENFLKLSALARNVANLIAKQKQ